MANTDWWGPTAPQTPQQQFHAQQAAQLQRNCDAEAIAFEEERRRRKKRGEQYLLIAGGSLLLGLGLFAIGMPREGSIFFLITLYSGRVGFRSLLRTF